MSLVTRARIPIALVVLSAATISGCGSTVHVTRTITRAASAPSTTGASSTTSATSATSTTTRSSGTTTTAPASDSEVTGRSPRSILAAAARALRAANGYAMHADLRQSAQRTLIALTSSGGRTVDATLATAGTVTEVINLPGASYLRGNDAFWRAQAGKSQAARARAAKLANHWLQVPTSGAHSVTRSLGSLAPGTLARCLTEDHGTLSITGHTMIGRTPAVIVSDAGNAPGATPSTIAVAATGTPYPLRYEATGPTRPGGPIDVCNDGKGGDAEGTITFDQFGEIPPIQPPVGAEQAPGGPTV